MTDENEKDLVWMGSSLKDLCEFPKMVVRKAGGELRKVQQGVDPSDWKSFDDVGPGTREIRLRDSDGIYRIMYVVKFAEAIFVLHCFHKTTQTTSKHDKEIAKQRYCSVVSERRKLK